jgi:hypothetical protein
MVRKVQSSTESHPRLGLQQVKLHPEEWPSTRMHLKQSIDLAEIQGYPLPPRQTTQSHTPRLVGRPFEIVSDESHWPTHGTMPFDIEVDKGATRALTIPPLRSERPRAVSVAPGIEVFPPELVPRKTKFKGRETRLRNKGTNYPPNQQHPAAPDYPLRVTPSWTRPDIYTPPPKMKADPEKKKRHFLHWCRPSTAKSSSKHSHHKLVNYASKSGLEPTYHVPIATKLVSDPFVARRRNRFALNLQRNKTSTSHRLEAQVPTCWQATDEEFHCACAVAQMEGIARHVR